MTVLTWDQVGEKVYEAGVDRGVLYLADDDGDLTEAHAWNGLVTVTESPSGAESNKQFADNIAYLNLLSAEEFGATIEAFTYPEAFAECDGTVLAADGVAVGQQPRKSFALCYRTKIGNDVDGSDAGYKLHIVYGCLASPSEKAYGTINDSPEAITFSWELTSTPVPAGDVLNPTSLLVIDSTKVDAGDLSDLEDILYGTVGDDGSLPLPEDIIAVFTTGLTDVNLALAANQPTFNNGTGVVTIPVVAGVTWTINGVGVSTGAQPAILVGETSEVEAEADPGKNIVGDEEWTFKRV